jgi:hypothetical protein
MLQEWRVVRQSTNLLFSSFTEEQMKSKGTASGHPISVNALGFIIFGARFTSFTYFKRTI